VTTSLEERLVILAAIAFLAALSAVAVVEHREPSTAAPAAGIAVTPSWTKAFVGSRGPVGDAQRTTCGQVLTAVSLGVTHPVLPCGTKIVLRNGSTEVLSEVIDSRLVEPGRDMEVTTALARMLHLEGTQELEWRFASDSDR
jgi:hypothetical protein